MNIYRFIMKEFKCARAVTTAGVSRDIEFLLAIVDSLREYIGCTEAELTVVGLPDLAAAFVKMPNSSNKWKFTLQMALPDAGSNVTCDIYTVREDTLWHYGFDNRMAYGERFPIRQGDLTSTTAFHSKVTDTLRDLAMATARA